MRIDTESLIVSSPPRRSAAFTEALIRRRWMVIAATLFVAVLLGAGTSRLRFEGDYRAFFSRANPQLTAFEELQNIYTKTDTVIIIVAPHDKNVFTRETLAVVSEVTDRAWHIPFAIRVDSLTNFQETRADGDDLAIDDLVPDARDLTDAELDRIRNVALSEPFLVDLLVSPRAHVTAVTATVHVPGKSLDEVNRSALYARELAADVMKNHPDVEIRLSGEVMFNHAFNEAAEADTSTLTPLMLLVLVVATFLVLRSVTATFAAFAVILLSAAMAMGAAGWLGIRITSISVLAPNMILVIAVCDVIHVLVSLVAGMGAGEKKLHALVDAVVENVRPVALTALTTMVGFLTMNFSDSPPLRHLGNITSMGVLAALVLTFTFLPALVATLPMRSRRGATAGADVRLSGLAGFVLRRRRALLWGSAALVLALAACVPLNELGDEFIEYWDHRFPIRGDNEFLVENLTGLYRMEFSISAGEPGGITDPEYLETLDRFAAWWRAQPEVVHTASFADVMKRVNKSLHGDVSEHYRVPEDRESAAQYLLLYEMSLPRGQDLNDRINVDKSATRMVVAMKNIKTVEIRGLAERGEGWLRDHAPPSMQAHATGPTVMFSHIFDQNVTGMIRGTALGFLVISGVLMLALRSVRYGLLSLVPNVVPALVAFGIWGIVEGEVTFAISVVAAMTLGIVDDDTVHWMSRYLDARRNKSSVSEAVRIAFSSVGKAIVATSFILVAGFVVLSFSGFRLNSDMAGLTAVTITVALVADLLLLPPLLMLLDREKTASPVLAWSGTLTSK